MLVAEFDEAELHRAPRLQVDRKARQIGHEDGKCRACLMCIVATGHCVIGDFDQAIESKGCRNPLAVDRKCGRAQRARAERTLVGSVKRQGEARRVPLHRVGKSEKIVAK